MQVRWLAVHMLLAFMGAAMGWAYSWRAFVGKALLAYMAGVSAQDLMDQVSQQEFSQAGTMFKAAASATIQSEKINAEAFSRWVPVLSPAFALEVIASRTVSLCIGTQSCRQNAECLMLTASDGCVIYSKGFRTRSQLSQFTPCFLCPTRNGLVRSDHVRGDAYCQSWCWSK